MPDTALNDARGLDFIRAIVAEDLRTNKHGGRVLTRFPPEPNGFLHIGHAKSICLNFGIAQEAPGGKCNLRFDDTNPETEDVRYVESIVADVKWLGFEPAGIFHASDYFDRMYAYAEHLIREGKAYVDSQSEDEIRDRRGTVTEPGRNSPFRDRSVEENLDLFRRMRAGEFPNGAHVLRAKIDMASPNMLLRDPLLYRIRHAHHYRTGDAWCIYPMYDYAHPLEDAIECVTHSFCTLEFEINRPLYDWVVENAPVECRPHQYEFARLNLDYTVMSKRKLLQLVKQGVVGGWDDPRMPTIAGLRRRGVTPEAIRNFCDMIGVAKADSRVDIGKLEYAIRDDLNPRAPRVLCVLRPLRVVLTDVAEGDVVRLDAPYFPRDVAREGSRPLPLTRTILIERSDFMESPPRGYHRLSPGKAVRLRHGPIVRCDDVVRDDAGQVVELCCSRVAEDEAGTIKGTIHWVSENESVACTVRLYDRLFTVPDPEEGGADFTTFLNPESLVEVEDARIEPSVLGDDVGPHYQFERLGYFVRDAEDSTAERPVFNRTVTLRDTWARQATSDQATAAEVRREAAAAETTPRIGREPATAASAGRGKAAAAGTPSRPAAPQRPRPAQPPRTAEQDVLARRLEREHGLAPDEAERIAREATLAELFVDAVAAGAGARGAANWIINELPRASGGRAAHELPFGGRQLGELVALVESGAIGGSAAREVLSELAEKGGEPAEVVERRGLRQLSDPEALWPFVEAVLNDSPDKVDAYRNGRTGLLGFFLGQVMQKTGGRANPEVVRRLVVDRLG